MPPTLIRRSLLGFNCLLRPTRTSTTTNNTIEFRRGEATYRRHIKKLSIPPAPSFGPQKPTRRALENAPPSSHIIFNPPPTAPNVYHTPLKLLPKSDPRRRMYADAATPSMYNIPSSSSTTATTTTARPGTALHEIAHSVAAGLQPHIPKGQPMPRALKPVSDKKYHVTPDQIKEMQQLRAQDPFTWTLEKLAEKFGCSVFFVRLCAPSREAHEKHLKGLEEAKARWGRKREAARRDRRRRKDLWGRDA